jgi:uncharacterized protein (TIGR02246 family)
VPAAAYWGESNEASAAHCVAGDHDLVTASRTRSERYDRSCAIIAEQVDAWNAGDGTRYANHLAPDVSFTNLFGMVMYGAPAFAKRHHEILSTFYKGTSKKHVVRRIRFVTPDVAIVDIDNEVHGVRAMPAGLVVPSDGVVKTQLMEVFAQRDGQWWIEAYHNVDVKPTAKP